MSLRTIAACASTVLPLMVGCGGRPYRATHVTELPMTFNAHGIALPVPLVEVAVNGVPTLFVVDTGSSDIVLTKEFADANHIASVADKQGTDHANEAVEVWNASGLALKVGTATRQRADVKIVAGPPPFVQLGIGGFLSPQNFVEHGYIVLDFPAHKMIIVDANAAQLREWIATRYRGASLVDVPRIETDHRDIYVTAALPNKPAVKVSVDTGGSGTEFDQHYVDDGTAGTPGTTGVSVSGAAIEGRTVEHQTISLAGHRVPNMTILSRDFSSSDDHLQGLLGIDILSAFVIAISADPAQPLIMIASKPPSTK